MLLNEEEAKTKFCYRSNGYSSDDEQGENCCASNCMAWRWHDGSGVIDSERRGYCGIAGIPQTR